MLVGDSLTGGTGASAPNSYRRALNDLLVDNSHTKDFVGPINWVNFENGRPDNQHAGLGGWGVNELNTGLSDAGVNFGRGKFSDWMGTYSPDTVLFFAGGNDSWQWYGNALNNTWFGNQAVQDQAVAWYRTEYQILLDAAFAQNPNLRFIFSSYPKNEKADAVQREYQNHLYGLMAGLAQDMVSEQQALGRNIQYVSLWENSSDVSGVHTFDGIHFNQVGAEHTANQFYHALTNPVPEPGTIIGLVAAIGVLAHRRKRG